MPVITCVDDLKKLHEKRAPRMFFDYCESGSWTESTFRANTTDFQKIGIRQRVAVNMEGRTTATKMIGQDVSTPIVLAPVGSTGMQHADGEILACRAAHKFGTQFILSTMSVCSIEDVADNVDAPFWFQLYVMRDREFTKNLIARAKAAQCSALIVTLDLQILGQRHKDLKNGLSVPPKPSLPVVLDLATKWRWGLNMLRTKRRTFRNVVGHIEGVTDTKDLSLWAAQSFDPRLSWDDLKWIKDLWGGPIIIKGIIEPDDAKKCVAAGADALIVSNHGGRQLDGAMSSIEALPGIVDAVGGKIEIHLDSGIRSGQDVLKAMALGATGTYIGRAFNYGLGAMGEEGVTKVLKLMTNELDLSMAFAGKTDVETLERGDVILPSDRAKMALGI